MDTKQTSPHDSPVLSLIDTTIEAFDQGQAASPQEGMSLLGDWFSSVENNEQAADLMQPMQALREELQQGSPRNTQLVELLEQLADLTEAKATGVEADLASRLTTLSTALRNFAGQLSTAV
ncbi:hypothetical protein [Rudanella lutea]|uniref:hypothetical protein n=1 Tax=Rudanella lutea TaxID=451374 RepID=UPI00036AEBB7|nr:hypothetical protein [Rudanella lutea]